MGIAIGMSGPNTKIIPGHGFGFTDGDGVTEVLTMLVELREKVTETITEGMQVLAANPTVAPNSRS